MHLICFLYANTYLLNKLFTQIRFGHEFEDNLIHETSSVSAHTFFLKNTFPSLQIFVFDNKACTRPIELLLSVYEFISRHHATLHTVTINSERSYQYLLYPSTVERWIKRLNKISEGIKLVQVKKLIFRTAAIIPEQFSTLKKFGKNVTLFYE